jgi:ketosteroid isomerase-like protein
MRQRGFGTAVLAVGFAVPAIAQPREIATPQEMRQQAEAIAAKYAEAVNQGDAKAGDALFSTHGMSITPYGVSRTQEKREETWAMVKKMGINLAMKVNEVQAVFGGQGAIVDGGYSVTYTGNSATKQAEGNFFQLLEREGDAWKIRVLSFTRLAPPGAAVATGATGAPASGTSTPPATPSSK